MDADKSIKKARTRLLNPSWVSKLKKSIRKRNRRVNKQKLYNEGEEFMEDRRKLNSWDIF